MCKNNKFYYAVFFFIEMLIFLNFRFKELYLHHISCMGLYFVELHNILLFVDYVVHQLIKNKDLKKRTEF